MTYLLLTLSSRSGPSFSPFDLWPKRLDHKLKGEKRGSVTYSTDREDEVSKMFIISLLCVFRVRERTIHAERLQISDRDAGRKQNESI